MEGNINYLPRQRLIRCLVDSTPAPVPFPHCLLPAATSRFRRGPQGLLQRVRWLIRHLFLAEVKWLLELSQIPEITEVSAFSEEAQLFLDAIIQETAGSPESRSGGGGSEQAM